MTNLDLKIKQSEAREKKLAIDKVKICTNIEYCYKNLKKKSKLLFIYCDDMIYSEFEEVKYVTKYLPEYGPLRNADIYLGVPYISITGLKNLQKKFPVKQFKSTKIIESLKELFVNNQEKGTEEISYENKAYTYKKKILDTEKLLWLYNNFCDILETIRQPSYVHENAVDSFQCKQYLIPIYFDHGIANYKFTFRKLLYFGTYPTTNWNECKYVNLIDNCEIKEKFDLYISERNNLCNLEDGNDNNIFSSNDSKVDYTTVLMGDMRNKCPKNFYETIKYKYYQEDEKPLDLPEGLESMKGFTIITVPVILKNRKKELNKSKMEHIKEWFYYILKKYLKYLKYKSKYFKLIQTLR